MESGNKNLEIKKNKQESQPLEREGFNLKDPAFYINRELSWLEFNQRVLEEAFDPLTPLMEKLKFLSIFTSNLDEFFMIRVGNLMRVKMAGLIDPEPSGYNTEQQLELILKKVTALVDHQYQYLNDVVLPGLLNDRISILELDDLSNSEKEYIREYFHDQILPVLIPLAFDASHPMPFLGNLKIHLFVVFDSSEYKTNQMPCAFIEVPSILSRLVRIPRKESSSFFVLLEEVIKAHLDELFPDFTIIESHVIRITRNLDYDLHENEVMDLMMSVEAELRDRSNQIAVRIEIQKDMSKRLLNFLSTNLNLDSPFIFRINGPLNLCNFMSLYDLKTKPDHYDPPFNPRLPQRVVGDKDIFAVIRQGDLLLHHPYDSFAVITDLLNAAADDPDVLAIKQTLYRTGKDSPIIACLIRAAENGKQVSAVMELKARFDEQSNIEWAKKMQDAGINLIYGFVRWKVHCKATLIVRREADILRRYVHLSTGNYNTSTAKLYTDIGLLTINPDFGRDVSALFNVITGFNSWTGKEMLKTQTVSSMFSKLILAPVNMEKRLLDLIQQEADNSMGGKPARIIMKINSLTESRIIRALYRASQAGVRIDLIVRGICCLRPGIKGVSENIRVISILDRFLEHSRIYFFHNNGDPEILSGSADCMPRNLYRRVEILYPVESPNLKTRLISMLTDVYLKDNVKAREQMQDGTYYRIKSKPGEKEIRSQMRFIEIARKGGIKSDPYEERVRKQKPKKKSKQ